MIVCLGAGKNQLPLIRAAKNLGYQVIAIDRDPAAAGFSLADKCINLSTYDVNNIIQELEKIAKNVKLQGVLARVSTPALQTASAISQGFDLPGITKDLLPLAIRKSKLREFCKKHGFLFPAGQKTSQSSERTDMELPLIIKPDVTIVGKKNIRIVDSLEDIQRYIDDAREISGNGLVEIEEYIDGIDIEVMFIAHQGKAVIVAIWDELVGVRLDGSITGLGISIPSVISGTESEKKLESIVHHFASFFPDISMMLTLCFRISSTMDPYFIELHADLGGDLVADHLLPAGNQNFDYFETVVKLATRELSDFQSLNFDPVTLLYNDKCGIEQKNEITMIRNKDPFLNLEKARELMNIELRQSPGHLEYKSLIR